MKEDEFNELCHELGEDPNEDGWKDLLDKKLNSKIAARVRDVLQGRTMATGLGTELNFQVWVCHFDFSKS
jgi:hypothetical protein